MPLSKWVTILFAAAGGLFAVALMLFSNLGMARAYGPQPWAARGPFLSASWLSDYADYLVAGVAALVLAVAIGLMIVDIIRRERLPD
jgi:hypothetical protein